MSTSAPTYSDLIEKALRALTPTAVEQSLQITTNYVAGSGTLVVDNTNPAYAAAGRPGTILGSGAGGTPQVWIVQKDNGSGSLSVIGGQQGSTDTNVTASTTDPKATVWVRPKFTRWDISIAINDELDALSSPDNGLGQVIRSNAITYVPVFQGYPLPATFDPATSKMLEVMLTEPLPVRRNPLIRRDEYRIDRSSYFGAGLAGLIVYRAGWPGLPLYVQYLAPFAHLVNLTDVVTSVAGVPIVAQDIVAMGATLRLAPDRELQRNSMGTQPDPRKAAEIPPGAIGRSADSLAGRYAMRISQERNRIMRAFPEAEGF